MHILQIYKDYYPVLGGIENFVKFLSEGLVARGHQVTVLVTSTTAQRSVERQGHLTIIKTARTLHLSSTPLSVQMLGYAPLLNTVDMMHLHFPYPPGDLVTWLVPHRPPLVVTYHSDIVRQRWLLQLYGPLLRHTLFRARRILATSPAYIQSSPWLRPHATRCTVVPLSIDTGRFLAAHTTAARALRQRYGTPIILFVGRLRYYKGLHFLLAALPHLRSSAHVLLAGSGPEESHLRTLVQETGLGQRVHFLGTVPDAELPALYQAANVFVLPSHLRSEAFGLVQIEAQASGLPLVCTELQTGTSYINQHGVTGFVVPPADPVALARALDVLLANPTLAQHMGAAGRARAIQEFSHAPMLDRTEQIYQSLSAHGSIPL